MVAAYTLDKQILDTDCKDYTVFLGPKESKVFDSPGAPSLQWRASMLEGRKERKKIGRLIGTGSKELIESNKLSIYICLILFLDNTNNYRYK